MPLVFRSHLDGFTGYGRTGSGLALGLAAAGIPFRLRPLSVEYRWQPPPAGVLERMTAGPVRVEPGEEELLHAPPGYAAPPHPCRAWLTVWDASRLPAADVGRLNLCRVVLTFTAWNRQVFLDSGVTVPVAVVPSFVPMYCRDQERPTAPPFVFGATANLGSQAERKNLPAAVQAFRRAFPGGEPVRLRIKLGQFDPFDPPDDPRIEIVRGCWSDEELCRWYGGLHALVHPARNEAWGLQVREVMAGGVPVLAARHAGLADLLHDGNSLPVYFREVPAGGMYAGHGTWADPDVDDLARQMRRLAADPELAEQLGRQAALDARRFTVEACVETLRTSLVRHGFSIDAHPVKPKS